MKFTFDVANCDKIFDELFKSGKIKMSHTIPPLDQLKRHAYCKFQNSFSHATGDCNIFCRQIQSAIMKVVRNSMRCKSKKILSLIVPLLILLNCQILIKVLIRPNQAEKAKWKNMIIGE
jgi:hypothetical protein